MNFTTASDEKMRLDNSNYLERKTGPTSYLDIEVVTAPQPVRNEEDLLSFAKNHSAEKGMTFRPVIPKVPGAEGVYADLPSAYAKGVFRLYYFLTTNHTIVSARLHAPTDSPGSDELLKTIESFTYDGKPPVITHVAIVSRLHIAGRSNVVIEVTAADDFSGLIGGTVATQWLGKNDASGVMLQSTTITEKDYNPKTHQLTVVTAIPAWIRQEFYWLAGLELTDLAGNKNSLSINFPDPPVKRTLFKKVPWYNVADDFYDRKKREQWAVAISVLNFGKEDKLAPSLRRVKPAVDPVTVPTDGSDGVLPLEFDGTDDSSGLIGGEVALNLEKVDEPAKGHGILLETVIEEAHHRGADHYIVPLLFSPHHPSGRYRSTYLKIGDRAGSLSDFVFKLLMATKYELTEKFPIEVEIKNTNPIDLEEPEILEASVVTPTVSAGGIAELRLKVFEATSGLNRGRVEITFIPEDGSDLKSSEIVLMRAVTKSDFFDKDTVRFLVKVPPFVKKTKYRLYRIVLFDRNRNNVDLFGFQYKDHKRAPLGELSRYRYVDKKSFYETYKNPIRVPSFEVTP